MKVTIFGATGSIGQLTVKHMLAHGHAVTAFARNPAKLAVDHPQLRRIAGDAHNAMDVAAALRDADAVVITLGAGMSPSSHVRSVGTRNVIAAMHHHGVRRLICQSTLGAHESWSNLNFFWKRIMFGLLLRAAHKDHELQEELVRTSGLDWTIVRPSAFIEGPETGRYKEDFSPRERRLSLTITREDVAAFLRRQLTELDYHHQAVGISN